MSRYKAKLRHHYCIMCGDYTEDDWVMRTGHTLKDGCRYWSRSSAKFDGYVADVCPACRHRPDSAKIVARLREEQLEARATTPTQRRNLGLNKLADRVISEHITEIAWTGDKAKDWLTATHIMGWSEELSDEFNIFLMTRDANYIVKRVRGIWSFGG